MWYELFVGNFVREVLLFLFVDRNLRFGVDCRLGDLVGGG